MSTITTLVRVEEVTRTRYEDQRRSHWDAVARREFPRTISSLYHRRLKRVYELIVPPDTSVLEVGCGQGSLLAALSPERGVGVDFSDEMLSRARQAHPELSFHRSLDEIQADETFDFIVLSDILNDVWDVQSTLETVRRFCRPETRVAINLCSHLWEWPHKLAQKLGAATPLMAQNWLTVEDLSSMLRLANFEMIRAWPEVLWPIITPGLDSLCNRWLVRFWPFRHFALTNFIVARPVDLEPVNPATVSVIVPARNESGNIEGIMSRVPIMGAGTELIFVEGNSTDDTFEKIEQTVRKFPHIQSKLLKQTGRGKGDAVRLGFSHAQGEILMILDADLTVPPEDLPRFYDALVSGKAEYVNGVRLVYPMEKQAMRFFNLIGNKFFSLAFSWILGQTIKDTLCGTKVLRKVHYQKIAANRSYFGDFDPFGDFDLIFGAAKANMKMLDLPIRYRERTYGDTNISRWRHGWLLLRMLVFALNRIKFV